jgi:RNA polymerase sigma factor (sigma-70 family)
LLDDRALMTAVRDGDLDQLGLLFERHHKHLYNFFLQQTGNSQSSEDMVQDVFYRMLKYRHTYRAESKFTTWMFSIAHNAKIDYYRSEKHRRKENDIPETLADDEPDPEEISVQMDQQEILMAALNALSDEKREVLVLSRFENMKYEEISEIMGCKVGTIKARVHWALKDLAQEFHKRAGSKAL